MLSSREKSKCSEQEVMKRFLQIPGQKTKIKKFQWLFFWAPGLLWNLISLLLNHRVTPCFVQSHLHLLSDMCKDFWIPLKMETAMLPDTLLNSIQLIPESWNYKFKLENLNTRIYVKVNTLHIVILKIQSKYNFSPFSLTACSSSHCYTL